MKKILSFSYIFIFFLGPSCSLLYEQKHPYDNFILPSLSADYIDQLTYLGDAYSSTPGIKIVQISAKTKRYLSNLYHSIVSNNELILAQNIPPKFFVINSQTPFYFSLPYGKFYFSTGLLDDYIINENLLVAILSFQTVKSLKNLYLKKALPPVGFIRTNRILSSVRVPLVVKNKINQWAYMCMKRAGYDGSAYLMWLQIQNKQSLDFSVQYGNIQSISREELVFKNFVATKESSDKIGARRDKNSSSDFYTFLKEVKRARK